VVAQIENVWYGRTVIRSVREMYYEQAQAVIDGTLSKEERAKLPDYPLLEKELRTLLDMSRAINVRVVCVCGGVCACRVVCVCVCVCGGVCVSCRVVRLNYGVCGVSRRGG
jgi:hypothetical protein